MNSYLDTLSVQLSTFTLPNGRYEDSICTTMTSSVHVEKLPHLYALAQSKGFRTYTALRPLVKDLGRDMGTMHALQVLMLSGAAAGMCGFSPDTQAFPHFLLIAKDSFDMQPDAEFCVLVHELGHVLTPLSMNRNSGFGDDVLEAIAYGTEYCIGRELGLDVEFHTLMGLTYYKSTPQILRDHSQVILSATKEILQWITDRT